MLMHAHFIFGFLIHFSFEKLTEVIASVINGANWWGHWGWAIRWRGGCRGSTVVSALVFHVCD